MWRLLLLLLCAGCVTTPESLLARMDVESDSDAEAAAGFAVKQLQNKAQNPATKLAAAKLLGRMNSRSAEVIEALGQTLSDAGESVELRAFAAWALGEKRSEASLLQLMRALERTPPEPAGERVL